MIALTIFASYPYLPEGTVYAHDLCYHFARILGISGKNVNERTSPRAPLAYISTNLYKDNVYKSVVIHDTFLSLVKKSKKMRN
mgnify:CR=1 FL=1